MMSPSTYMYIQLFFIYLEMHKLSRFISFFFTVQVCPVRNTWSPEYLCIYTHIYIVLKTRLNICVTLTCFFLVVNAKMPREPTCVLRRSPPTRMVEDHLPYQHLRHARGFPTPCPPLRLRGVQRKDGFPFFGQDKIIFEKLFFSRGI